MNIRIDCAHCHAPAADAIPIVSFVAVLPVSPLLGRFSRLQLALSRPAGQLPAYKSHDADRFSQHQSVKGGTVSPS